LSTLLLTLLPALGRLTEEIVEFIAHDGCGRLWIGEINGNTNKERIAKDR